MVANANQSATPPRAAHTGLALVDRLGRNDSNRRCRHDHRDNRVSEVGIQLERFGLTGRSTPVHGPGRRVRSGAANGMRRAWELVSCNWRDHSAFSSSRFTAPLTRS